MTPDELIDVTDVKQYVYCPRIPFYRYCLPAIRPVTYGMREGTESHREERDREERRSLRPYGLVEGERTFDVRLRSERLGLVGRLDMLVRVQAADETEEAVVVDYKLTRGKAGTHFRAQVGAYALLVEECLGLRVRRGFLYSLAERKAEEILISPALRRSIPKAVTAILSVVRAERMPDPPANRARCVACEFRRFCNDAV